MSMNRTMNARASIEVQIALDTSDPALAADEAIRITEHISRRIGPLVDEAAAEISVKLETVELGSVLTNRAAPEH